MKSSKVGSKNHPYLHLTDDNQIPRPSRVLVKFGEGPDFEFKGIPWGLLNPGANPSAEEYFYTYQGYNLRKGVLNGNGMPGGPTFNPRHYHFCFMMNNCIIEVNDMYLNLGLAFVYGPNTNFTGRGKGSTARTINENYASQEALRKLQIQAPNFFTPRTQQKNKRGSKACISSC